MFFLLVYKELILFSTKNKFKIFYIQYKIFYICNLSLEFSFYYLKKNLPTFLYILHLSQKTSF